MKTPTQIALFLSQMKRIVEEKGFILVDRDNGKMLVGETAC